MNITQTPASIHTAYNPVVIKATKGDESQAKIYLIPGWYSELPAEGFVTKEHEYFNDTAQFDIKSYLTKLFKDDQSNIESMTINNSLFAKYSVFTDTGLLYQAIAINGVVQIGVSSDFTSKRGFFLTEFETLKVYSGYEYTIYTLAFEGGTTYLLIDNQPTLSTKEKHFGYDIQAATSWIELQNSLGDKYLRDNLDNIITDNLGNPIEILIIEEDHIQRGLKIIKKESPTYPLWIRWTNQRGGKDHWMFSCKHPITKATSDTSFFEPAVDDQLNAKGFKTQIKTTGNEKLSASTGMLNYNESNVISKIIYSPDIEWYNEDIKKWISVFINDASISIDNTAAYNDFEIVFELPTPQLQF